MRFNFFKLSLLSLALTVSVACQRNFYPQPALQQTKLAISDKIANDDLAEKTIVPYREKVTTIMAEVLGTAPETIERSPVESPIGNFVADLQRAQAEKLTGKPIDLGLMTSGGIRTALAQGSIKTGDIFELMPFENELVVITVKGETLQQLFDYAAQNHIYTNPRKVLSFSNVSFCIKDNKPQDIFIGPDVFDPAKTYTIALSDYLASGGDNLDFLKNQTSIFKTGVTLRDAISNHIKDLTAQGKPVEAKVDGRVKTL
jgi:2',3'-cyclic-nucleotide 2'-phosphodiesterase (5'-nucleotidase family)